MTATLALPSAAAWAAQPDFSMDSVVLGESADLSIRDGDPNGLCAVGVADRLAPALIPGIGVIDLDLAHTSVLFELGLSGNGAWDASVVADVPGLASGQVYYLQTLCTDSSSATGYEISEPIERGIHPDTSDAEWTQILQGGQNDYQYVPLFSGFPYPGIFNGGSTFPFYGQSYQGIYVTEDGVLSFDPPPNSYIQTILGKLFNPTSYSTTPNGPYIAPFLLENAPSGGLDVYVQRDTSSEGVDYVRFFWGDPEHYELTETPAFEATLYEDGRIRFMWPQLGDQEGTIAISPGGSSTPVWYNYLWQFKSPYALPQTITIDTGDEVLDNVAITFEPDGSNGYSWYR